MEFKTIPRILKFGTLLLLLPFLALVQCKSKDLGICCDFSEFVNGTCVQNYSPDNGNYEISDSNQISEWFKAFLEKQGNIIPPRLQKFLPQANYSFLPQGISCSGEVESLFIPFSRESLNDTVFMLDDKPLKFMPNSAVFQWGIDNFFPLQDYCLNRIDPNLQFMELQTCLPASCSPLSNTTCIRKCCDVDSVWDLSLYPDSGPIRCRPSGRKTWKPVIYSGVNSLQVVDILPQIQTNYKFSCGDDDQELVLFSLRENFKFPKRDLFKILPTGEVWRKIGRKNWQPFPPGQYCIDGAMNFGKSEGILESYSGDLLDTLVLSCHGPGLLPASCYPPQSNPSNSYGISFAVASVFLLMTSVVYILLWEKQNIHGWTSLAYFASLFGMYVFTALYKFDYLMFTQGEGGSDRHVGCFIIAIGGHFFWLSSFCWMSVVNFDLWWTFRSLLPTGSKSKGLKRFLAYVLFAIGLPLLMVGGSVGMDIAFRSDLESDIITPEYGKLRCFLDTEIALFPYLFLPIGILLSVNLLFFTVTVYDMYKIQQSTKFASNSSSAKNSRQKQSILLFVKLFLLMGIPWAFEVISWAATPCGTEPWYWTILDYINIFQAVAIFFTFVCKSDTRKSLEAKYPCFKQLMSKITIKPDKAKEILDRRPRLRFFISPFTRTGKQTISRKTQSTVINGEHGQGPGSRRSSNSQQKSSSVSTTNIDA